MRQPRDLAEDKAAFQRGNSRLEFPLTEVEKTGTEIRVGKARCVIDRPGDLDPVFCSRDPLGKLPQFSERPD